MNYSWKRVELTYYINVGDINPKDVKIFIKNIASKFKKNKNK